MFAYHFSAFGDSAPRSACRLLETAITEFLIMFFVRFMQTAEFDVANWFMHACIWTLSNDGHICANDGDPATALERNEGKCLKMLALTPF